MSSSKSPYFKSNKVANGHRPPVQASSKKSGSAKRNTSILNFFSKTEVSSKPTQNRITQYGVRRENSGSRGKINVADDRHDRSESLFFDEDTITEEQTFDGLSLRPNSLYNDLDDLGCQGPTESTGSNSNERYNEYGGSMKRQKVEGHITNFAETVGLGSDQVASPETPVDSAMGIHSTDPAPQNTTRIHRHGPFIDESDSDDDDLRIPEGEPSNVTANPQGKDVPKTEWARESEKGYADMQGALLESANNPELQRRSDPDGQEGSFQGSEVCTSDSIISGREDHGIWPADYNFQTHTNGDWEIADQLSEAEFAICPICGSGLDGMTDTDASLHVNNCLDGNPTPPRKSEPKTISKDESAISLTRAERKLVPRPGQRNPPGIGTKASTTSAFSKLMSANAEDSAWATAAASEQASRGKQAYERTCPFYKILPGFSICVDAFRYGAVERCNAYFLSHFHSDHYVGLNASWGHGPIYCSRVTGNLVRQQLKVDPSWVVDIDWETKTEIPDTDGVYVTMIPANHCPGSSLFLFEKTVGNGKNPKVQRILHCGDFRACPAHVQHPLLRPNLLESKTGRSKEQIIDICYLDTTYLNPKYAFPDQGDVVAACAEKCLALNGDSAGLGLGSRSGQTMANYLSESKDKAGKQSKSGKGRLLVVIGTYSIGKERICLGIARALKSKIYAPAAKQRICACLEDEELSNLLTTEPLEAQVHMHSLMEIRGDTLLDYLNSFKPHFSRVAGFRPTGWNYRPPAGRMTDSPPVRSVLYSDSWKARFLADDLVAQRGSNSESMSFSVPYSEHSSFRELTMFCSALRISRVIPTVNVASPRSRERMKMWVERWEAEKRKSGLFQVEEGSTRW